MGKNLIIGIVVIIIIIIIIGIVAINMNNTDDTKTSVFTTKDYGITTNDEGDNMSSFEGTLMTESGLVKLDKKGKDIKNSYVVIDMDTTNEIINIGDHISVVFKTDMYFTTVTAEEEGDAYGIVSSECILYIKPLGIAKT